LTGLNKNELDRAILWAHRPNSTAARFKTARIGERTMTVARILQEKGRDVFTTQPHRTLKEVIGLLAEKGVGAVVVSDASQSVLGILSERDVVRVLAKQGASALDDPVSRYMTPKVITARREDTIDHVRQTMTAGRFRHVPIVEDGRLIGIVSIGDVVKHHVNQLDSERQALREYIATA
jgi:CBS domain-containing protein